MKPSQDIKPITYLKTSSAELIQTVVSTGRPVVITQSGEAKAVVMDIKTFEKNRDMLFLLKLAAQGMIDVEEGHLIDQETLFESLEAKIHGQMKSKKHV